MMTSFIQHFYKTSLLCYDTITSTSTNDHRPSACYLMLCCRRQRYTQSIITMNRKFTPTALALVLSTSAIVVDSNSISTVGDANSSSDRLKVDGIAAADVINQYRRKATTEEEQKLSPDNTLDDGTISTDGNGSNTDAIEVDVGILFRRHHVSGGGSSSSTIPRFLQEAAAEEAPTCAYPETCEPNLCACSAKGGYAYDCAAELHAVCKKVYDADGTIWTLDGCVGDVSYYAKVYCPFAKCIVEGGSYATCSCQMYQTVCDLYGDLDKYKVGCLLWNVNVELLPLADVIISFTNTDSVCSITQYINIG